MIRNRKKRAKVIGLTGGIGSGKSTVSRMLRGLGARIIDTDQISRDLVQKGSPLLEEIVLNFGKEILLASGQLNRKKLGEIIFSNQESRALLDQLTHPKIIDELKRRLKKFQDEQIYDLIVVDCALLFEMDMETLVDESWLVYVSETVQVSRIMSRDQLSKEAALKRIQAQMPLEEKLQRATAKIDNSKTIENTHSQVFDLWSRGISEQ